MIHPYTNHPSIPLLTQQKEVCMSTEREDESGCDGSEEDDMAGIRITDEQIAGWKTRVQEIDGDMSRLAEEKAKLQRKLAAIAELEEPSFDDPPELGKTETSKLEAMEASGGPSLVEAIALVTRRHRGPLTPKQIKRGLPEVGFIHTPGLNYFYTAIKRAVGKGTIVRTADKRYTHGDFAASSSSTTTQ